MRKKRVQGGKLLMKWGRSVLGLLAAAAMTWPTQLSADLMIVGYLEQPPQDVIMAVKEEMGAREHEVADTFGTYVNDHPPSTLSRKAVQGALRENMIPHVGGFPVVYQGYNDFSDDDGLISFPLRHSGKETNLVVASKLRLETMREHTVLYPQLIIQEGAPAKRYAFRKQTDPKSKKSFWQVTEEELPKGGKIGPSTLLIRTNPANIYVARGAFMADGDAHLILPRNCLFVVGESEKELDIVAQMDIQRYFESVDAVAQKTTKETTNQVLLQNS